MRTRMHGTPTGRPDYKEKHLHCSHSRQEQLRSIFYHTFEKSWCIPAVVCHMYMDRKLMASRRSLAQPRTQHRVPTIVYLQFQLDINVRNRNVNLTRAQSFVYAGDATDCLPVKCSVPQRSIFGPRRFTAYTEDLTAVSEKHCVHSHICADDTTLRQQRTC